MTLTNERVARNMSLDKVSRGEIEYRIYRLDLKHCQSSVGSVTVDERGA